MKFRAIAVFACLFVGLGLTSVGCVNGEEQGGQEVLASNQVETITAREIAALAPGKNLHVDLRSDVRFRFDSSLGALDLARISVTDLSGKTENMDRWLAEWAPDLSSQLPKVFDLMGQVDVGVANTPGVAAEALTIIYVYVRDQYGNVIAIYRIVVPN